MFLRIIFSQESRPSHKGKNVFLLIICSIIMGMAVKM